MPWNPNLAGSTSQPDNVESPPNPAFSPVSQSDLNLKAPKDSPTFTGTVSGITKGMVGLPNAENTADLDKVISTAVQAALDGKLDLYADQFITENALSVGQAVIPRVMVSSSSLAMATGGLRLTYFTSKKTDTYTKIRTVSGNTAGVGMTLCRVGVYSVASDGALTLVGATPNTPSMWTAAATQYEVAASASFTLTRGQRYAFGIIQVGATTAPTMTGISSGLGGSGEHAVNPRIASNIISQTDLAASYSAAAVAAATTFTGFFYGVFVP